MKKIFAIGLSAVMVLSPYSVNFDYFGNLAKTKIYLGGIENGKNLSINEYVVSAEENFQYVPEEVEIIQQINEQITNIEENLKVLENQDMGGDLEDIVEEIKAIDIQKIEAESLNEQSEEMGLDNTEVIVETLEDDDLSLEEATQKILENENLSEEENSESFLEDTEASAETLNDNSEIIEDPLAVESEEIESFEETPKNILLSSEISVNIVEQNGDETTVTELGDYVEEVVEENESEEYSLITKDKASATKLVGFFFVGQRSSIIDMNTQKPKYRNSAEITYAGGLLRPSHYSIKLTTKRKSSDGGKYSTVVRKTVNNAKVGKSYHLDSSISKTYFWKAYANATGSYWDGSRDYEDMSSSRVLINKKGVPYPNYKDPKSGKKMLEPSSTTWTKKYYPESWTTAKRTKYLNWYENKYRSIKREDYEVHHIRPRVYYGSNDYSNLIPLKKTYHKQVVNNWWKNY